MRAFLGWLRGEKRHCSMAAIPTIEEEDARRPSRERESLVGEQTRLVNRIKAVLTRLGIRSFRLSLRSAADRLAAIRTAEETPLPDNTCAELSRLLARLSLVREQLRTIEQERLRQLAAAPGCGGERPARDGTPHRADHRHRRRDGRHSGPRGPVAACAIAAPWRAMPG
ncbi:hypothetical protein [Mesorhizobium sp. M0408]|uniref:hypothetical protein n=1 Tax=Mesorhizobium sp. M0408 TaxID=2956942 RepID=UPI0033352AD5